MLATKSEQFNDEPNFFSSLFILDVATYSQKDQKLFSATHFLCSKKDRR